MPEAVPRIDEVDPAGLTQVARAAGLTPIFAATAALSARISSAIRRCSAGSKASDGLSIIPVIEQPSSASRRTIASVVAPRYGNSSYPACTVPRIAAPRAARANSSGVAQALRLISQRLQKAQPVLPVASSTGHMPISTHGLYM